MPKSYAVERDFNLSNSTCDECGETCEVRETVDNYAWSFGASHKVCRECYNETPEPDTGRPDWEDLPHE